VWLVTRKALLQWSDQDRGTKKATGLAAAIAVAWMSSALLR
jgi:hypothetical protein